MLAGSMQNMDGQVVKHLDATELIQKLKDFLEEQYKPELLEQVRLGKKFLHADFTRLSLFDPVVADALLDNPEEVLKAGELAVEQFDLSQDAAKGFALRFINLPESSAVMIRNIRAVNLNKFLTIEGVVRQKSDVRPHVTTAKFECPSCGNIISMLQLDNRFKEPSRCSCGRKGKFRLLGKELVDAQGLVLEEIPEQLEGGEQPKRLNIFLKNDLVSPLSERKTNPGSRIIVVGAVKEVPIVTRSGAQSTKFDLLLEANSVFSVQEDFSDIEITKEDEEKIKELANEPHLMKKIIKSVAPSIYGHDRIKEALALQMMGGIRKKRDDGVVTRGDIHILLVGDPGAAKSQMLKRINVVAPKARYITGKGASLDYDEPLLIKKNEIIKTIPIGSFVDENYIPDTENLMVPLKEKIETLALNQKTCKLEWKPIKYVYRHREKEDLFKFTLETGRQVAVTGDHSIFILENGKPAVKPAKDLTTDNCVLIPRKIPKALSPYKISVEAARLLGYYIAEGHTICKDGSYKIEFTLNKDETWIVEDIKKCSEVALAAKACVYPKDENSVRVIIYGKHPYNLFAFLLGDIIRKKAKEKGIPSCIVNAQPEAQREFINAYIAGDAGVTKSRKLMCDLLYLFLQQNIIATVNQRPDNKCTQIKGRTIHSTGNRYDLKSPRKRQKYKGRYTRPPFSSISNNTLTAFFREAKSSGYSRASKKCAENKLKLHRLQALSSGIMHGKHFRELFGESALEYAGEHSDLFEKQKTGRDVLISISEKGRQVLQGFEQIEKLQNSDLGFARIKKIERVKSSSEFVYDVSVPGFESFVGGFGGIICHNSGAGLSATVVKDEFLQGWSLEAGALVLANKGLCAIDELDKMSREDSWAMHEALEQQSVTISKANIQATLRCETTVLAAANPKFGRFDPYETVAGQIDLAPTLINRFDLIFPIKDLPDPSKDEKLASFILELHQTNSEEPDISTEMLRKYIAYARQKIKPKLTDSAIEEIKNYFLKMRASASGEQSMRSIPISARQLEGLIRLSEACAKMYLRDKVTKKDAKRAIDLLDYCLRQVALDTETGQFDIDRIATGTPASQRNKIVIVKEIIAELENKLGKTIPLDDVVKEATEKGLSEGEVEEIIQKLKRSGDLFEPKHGFVSRI